jgi:hypothetical protein
MKLFHKYKYDHKSIIMYYTQLQIKVDYIYAIK